MILYLGKKQPRSVVEKNTAFWVGRPNAGINTLTAFFTLLSLITDHIEV